MNDVAKGHTVQRFDQELTLVRDQVLAMGCTALYFHGAHVDDAYRRRDEATLRVWFEHARSAGVPVGVAGHAPEAHLWVDSLGLADFHAVCFFNCGSLHDSQGERFRLADMAAAVDCSTEALTRNRRPSADTS